MMVNVGICIPDKLGDTETKFKRKAAKLNLQILERNGRKGKNLSLYHVFVSAFKVYFAETPIFQSYLIQ